MIDDFDYLIAQERYDEADAVAEKLICLDLKRKKRSPCGKRKE